MASQEEVNRLKGKLERIHEAGQRAMGKAKCIAETNGAAFLGGFLHAYFKDPTTGAGPNLYGIPLIPAAGILALGAGLYTEEAYGDDLINVGNGLTSAFSAMMGDQMGGNFKAGKGLSITHAGELPASYSSGYTPQDIANMMAHAAG